MKCLLYTNRIYDRIFTYPNRKLLEKIIFGIAITAFILHFLLLLFANWGWLPKQLSGSIEGMNPIFSIYTPFSIILLYEIFLLIYYLSRSITSYLGKQYKIIALILIREIFKELAEFYSSPAQWEWANLKMLAFHFTGFLVLALLIFFFYKLEGHKEVYPPCKTAQQRWFIRIKKVLSLGLLLIFIGLFILSLVNLSHSPLTLDNFINTLKEINFMFFDTFFGVLIVTEVLLLLFTFNLSDRFSEIIRYSGFIISTILLKISFQTEGYMNLLIVLIAVAFGVAILGVYTLFERKLNEDV